MPKAQDSRLYATGLNNASINPDLDLPCMEYPVTIKLKGLLEATPIWERELIPFDVTVTKRPKGKNA